ncbi:MAG: hypothetical protein HQ537_01275 [Parcubacteria group bacterium]|nr:hypothetical protein [Parcubacteria group bacterium]
MISKDLLTSVLDWPEEKINKAVLFKDSYRLINRKKKDGSLRKIYAPHPDLKRFQRRFLKYFLYRIPLISSLPINGFRPKFSYIDNTKEHAQKNVRFVLRLDFRDAFPSVKIEYLRIILKKVLFLEVKGYMEKNYRQRPLFPNKRVQWFRKLLRDLPQLNLFSVDPLKILDEFVELILPLITYQGKLPQGASTSPCLLNIVLCYSGLLEKIYQFLWDNRILFSENDVSMVNSTIYADDLTISSSEPISRSSINQLIDLIEQESPFKINRQKISYFNRARIAPLVTGLRIVRLVKEEIELENFLSNKDLTYKQKKNILRRTLNKKGKWIITSVSLPKKQIRRIRGLIYRAISEKALAPIIDGHMANLKAIYGQNLPNQIMVPYKKYLITEG